MLHLNDDSVMCRVSSVTQPMSSRDWPQPNITLKHIWLSYCIDLKVKIKLSVLFYSVSG